MQLRYGSYAHDLNEVTLDSIQRRTEYGARGAFKLVETWSISGRKIADSQSALTQKLTAMELAYSVSGKDVVFLDNSGNRTVHQIINSNTLGGVRIPRPPSYPDGEGAQYATYRDYQLTLEADYALAGLLGNYSEYQETVTFTGGLPLRVVIELDFGDPVEQIVRERTAFRASQSGRLLSLVPNPLPPNPRWPSKIAGRQITQSTPIENNGSPIQYPLDWSYEFISATPLS